MRYLLFAILVVFSSAVLGAPDVSVGAVGDLTQYKVVRFNNENWYTLPHPRVSTFTFSADGSIHGTTEDGRTFVQYAVPNQYGIRVHRFEIDDHYHYIVDGEIADTFGELSALLAIAYKRTIVAG